MWQPHWMPITIMPPEIGGGIEREVVQDMSYKVRKLTPLECERLQGFPDNWTKYGNTEKKGTRHKVLGIREKISDTQRYKACGNSVAIPCVEFVIEKIVKELENE